MQDNDIATAYSCDCKCYIIGWKRCTPAALSTKPTILDGAWRAHTLQSWPIDLTPRLEDNPHASFARAASNVDRAATDLGATRSEGRPKEAGSHGRLKGLLEATRQASFGPE